MRAVIARRPGPPEVLEPVDLPDPEPGPGQVVVDVTFAAITFVDTQMRSGAFPRIRPEDFPLVLGNGVTGTVVAVGEGVVPGWLGAEVVTATGGRGGYASRAVASASDLHRVPAGLDPRDAVALLADGRTALGLARAAGVGAGDVVAITAAGGGVGSLLVQIAHRSGATVVALAGDAAKRDLALGLGADAAVDYREPGWPAAARPPPRPAGWTSRSTVSAATSAPRSWPPCAGAAATSRTAGPAAAGPGSARRRRPSGASRSSR